MKNGHWKYETCSACDGSGMQGNERCSNCNGNGEVKVWIEDDD